MKQVIKVTAVIIGLLLGSSQAYGQLFENHGVKGDYLGYGWIIALSNNLIFVPAKDSISYPTVTKFFEEKNKFGFEISNQVDPTKGKPVAPNWVTVKIEWPKEGEGNLNIIPVMAYYQWRDKKDLGGNQHSYKYQDREDEVTYQLVSSFIFKYITLE